MPRARIERVGGREGARGNWRPV